MKAAGSLTGIQKMKILVTHINLIQKEETHRKLSIYGLTMDGEL